MSSALKQIFLMIRVNLGSLPRRRAISLSMVLSVALVVAVLAGFLAMARGFEAALAGAGSPDIAVILGGGTNQEAGSDVPAEAIRSLAAASGDTGIARNPGIARGGPGDGAGGLAISREVVVPVDVRAADGVEQTLSLRGMDPAGPAMRERARLSEGRPFVPGGREIVVGARLADAFPGLAVGDTVRLGAVDWRVAGHFTSGGSAFESEIWANLEAVQSAFDRQRQVQSLRVRLAGDDPQKALAALRERLSTLPGPPLAAVSEADLYAGQAERTKSLIRLFGWPIALLMAIGATAGALNTMMSSVSDRAVEIAALRLLGFARLPAFAATWVEAVLLSAVGAAIGAIASRLVFDGWQASTMGANNTKMAFQLVVTPEMLLTAGLLGLAGGVIGGTLPALAAARLPLRAALRARG
ncbi:UNVERIFIED_ORG: putative ABC transport system permease protein [Rhizobium esperanzae]|uniref:ABC transporter permease FtsX-like protein n=1 Tax=Rhizobium phaseoli TaxID=396 RepID=A0A192TC94_9HYPH|nr:MULTISPECIES: ABC transporter permease [Rhizobium]MDH6650777.1 putative ABC transport system permease protein [Rhizobium esperanzae]ANL41091.1 ABC transporter permease FtsX-like protein [Rhizobium phaseoli]ANL53826.1 ABC transporter permease FtsX-like protein [Rhizobium phaseoli]ANL60079.1 ABC transporter permease FtsX-like protein [Rhizobium phaseoli]ANL85472.1 ABC transporter permease FtsX-like protein [Rhizobium phaseoli]